MDYALFPPEINSARIYSGPGSGSLLAAAGSWDSLSAELGTTAQTYESVLSTLTTLQWRGPASESMTTAATPYVQWLTTTAQQTKQTAMQARAAAAAFDQAFAMTVPPPVIAVNRAQLQALIATNFFGQNTAAIAATEAHYAEMWAQDATAMNAYAATSATASRLTPFASPQQTTNPDGVAAQSAAATQAAADPFTTVYSALQGLSTQLSNALASVLNLSPIPISANPLSVLDSIQLANASFGGIGTFAGLPASMSSHAANLLGMQANMAYLSGLAGPAPALGPIGLGGGTPGSGLGGLTNAVTASMSRANAIGPMSVPASWSAPSTGRIAALEPAGLTTLAGTDELAGSGYPGVPGMPAGTLARASGVLPRYGTRLTVMTRPPAGG
ncbi:PPE family protein [Mycobacterium terramassiliense]|uniref:PPE family protein n=1 Tax=Mycobacterium terramassiliense TaxID=1841859 RepID=A0A2U3N9T0_9MYCO|nr:PPE family protein [Mycobacterium terramassiliense]SPM28281.1 PPE family protein [Mycobacterium terramassiliense]